MTDRSSLEDMLSRREMLATTGTALATGFAGCGGNSGEETTTGSTDTTTVGETTRTTDEEKQNDTTEELLGAAKYVDPQNFPRNNFVYMEDFDETISGLTEVGATEYDMIGEVPNDVYETFLDDWDVSSFNFGNEGHLMVGDWSEENMVEKLEQEGLSQKDSYKGFRILEDESGLVLAKDGLLEIVYGKPKEKIDAMTSDETVLGTKEWVPRMIDELDGSYYGVGGSFATPEEGVSDEVGKRWYLDEGRFEEIYHLEDSSITAEDMKSYQLEDGWPSYNDAIELDNVEKNGDLVRVEYEGLWEEVFVT